jgi:hypothetical protein
MKKPAICLLTAIILIFTLIPTETVQAAPYNVEGYELWDADRPVDDDVIIGDGDHLEIRNATLTMSCTEKPVIEVQSGGRLTITGATLRGDGTAGCWQGIRINSGDNLSSITDSYISDASTGVYIRSSGPTVTDNEITNLRGADANPEDTFPSAEDAAGIYIEETDEDHVPTIRGNTIHHVFGATGFSGADGDLENGRGDDGLDGGMASGIIVKNSERIIIENNVIEELNGGACGDGGNGLDGADGALGEAGENGYMGGAAGDPGLTIGIYVVNVTTSEITGNTIRNLYASPGCNGGDGGDGGSGGAGAAGTIDSPPGDGAQGGEGTWSGGASRFDRVVGIDVRSDVSSSPHATTISGNTIHDLFGAMGGVSGNGGNGGTGGAGGSDTDESADAGFADGGNGGSGGKGGLNGRGESGSDAFGIYTSDIDQSDILGNKIYSLVAGDGQISGVGGNGGTGGAGGNGGTNSLEIPGDGGAGGSGGEFGLAWATGEGGDARGVFVENRSISTNFIANNDIWDITAGKGADGAKAGDGGDGGQGGDGGWGGVGGQGGSAYRGREGAMGGQNGDSAMIFVADYWLTGDSGLTSIVNNTLVGPSCATIPSAGGPMSLAGAPGAGGVPDGPAGLGAEDGEEGNPGDSATLYGIFRGESNATVEVFNNIIISTFSYPGSYSIFDSYEGDGVISIANNNHLTGWYAGEVDENTGESLRDGVLLGPYTTGDPGFVSAEDHHLTEGSPCVDAGDNDATNLPSTDFDGFERIQDGNHDTHIIVDAGAYELEGSTNAYYLPIFLK